GLHLAEEEGQEKRADMGSVHVGVGEDDDLVVTDLVEVELLPQARADGGDQGLDLRVLQHLVHASALDVEDLAAAGGDGLGGGVARLDGRTTRRVALNYEQL